MSEIASGTDRNDSATHMDNSVKELKVPPHSIDAEQSVLGGLLLDDEAWFKVSELLISEDFYRSQHQVIYKVMMELSVDNNPMDGVTVADRLQSKGLLEKAGGVSYIGELAESTPGVTNVVAYAKIVHEHATMRRIISAANRIAETAFNPEGRVSDELLNIAEQEVFQISESRLRDGGPEGVVPLLERAVERVEHLYTAGSSITGLSTGFDDLDKKTAGLQKSDLIIVAARPSVGKTALAVNIAEHAAMVDDDAVLIFSMEMPSEQIVIFRPD